MSKGESGGGFLSKVAQFVRHPTVNWSELDSRLPGAGTEEDRQALKAAIERKRRNDQVRKKEFDELRLLLQQRQAARQNALGEALESVAVNPSGSDDEKARTIEKIARIEAQMAQHWLARKGKEGAEPALHISSGTTIPGTLDGGVTLPAHLQSRAARDMAPTLPIDMLADEALGPAPPEGLPPEPDNPVQDGVFLHQAIEEAAVRFANGDSTEAVRQLRALMAQEPTGRVGRAAWLSLLDLYHAQGLLNEFEETAAEYAEKFACAVPRWPAPQPKAGGQAVSMAASASVQEAASDARVWECPMLLDEAAVSVLGRTVRGPGRVYWLDWTGLVAADLSAAEALLRLVQDWLTQPLELRFLGSGVLRRRLKASTPSGRRENETLWWQLRLSLLRLMQRSEEFDLAALDFCVTYGVLPPVWEPPVCHFEMADALPSPAAGGLGASGDTLVEPEVPLLAEPIRPLVTQLGGLDVLEWPDMGQTQMGTGITLPPDSRFALSETTAALPALSGVLKGEIPAVLAHLQAQLDQHPAGQVFSIDCQELAQTDFVAAGSLMQCLLGAMGRGIQVQLTGLNRLVAAFFHVVGIDEAVTMRLREY